MGWLFAAAIGLQRRSRAAILRALVPIALGHAIAVGLTLVAVVLLRTVVDLEALKAAAAILLVAFGLNMLIARHRGRAGMQVGSLDLVLWSFLMATAHRSEEHTSELQSLMRISYAVFCLKKKTHPPT